MSQLYEYSGSAWVAIANNGAPGSVWHSGAGAPSTLYNNGDYYLNTSTGDIYEQVSGAWGSPIENITGATGPAGVVQAVTSTNSSITVGGTTANPTVGLTIPVTVANGGTGSATGIASGVSLVVAASNASAKVKAGADYVCTGTGDEVQINDAITALSSTGGTILLSAGRFNLANPINLSSSGVTIQGSGLGNGTQGTQIYVTNGANCNAFQYVGVANVQFCEIKNLYINGNGSQVSGTNTSGYGIYINPIHATFTATTNATTTLSAVSSFTNIVVGSYVTGSGIPQGTTVSSIDTSTSTLVMSNAATASATAVTITPSNTFWDLLVRDVWVTGTSQDGFYAYDGHGYVLDHFLAEYCNGVGANFPANSTLPQAEPEVRNGTFKYTTGAGIVMGIVGGVVAENEIQGTTGDAITLNAAAKAINNWIGECKGNGITLNAEGAIAQNNYIFGSGGQGISMPIYAAIAQNNYILFSSGNGVDVTNTDCIISNNLIGGNSLNGINSGSDSTVITGNYIYSNNQYGVYATGLYATIANNMFFANSQTTANTYDEIYIGGNSGVVMGNVINGNSQSRYGINFISTGVNEQAIGNNVGSEVTASYSTCAGATIINSSTAAFTGALSAPSSIFTASGSTTATPVEIILNSSGAPNGINLYNQSNYAQNHDMEVITLVNASDSGNALTLSNAGTGKNINSTNGTATTFSVDKSGNTVANALTLSTALPVASGGTGSTTQNFVDLTTVQTIAGAKTLTSSLTIDGNLSLNNIGNKINIATGTNASIGTAVLVAGTVTVDTTAVTASSIIMLTRQVTGGTVGELSIGTITAGTSFVINSASSTDTSTVGYLIIN